MEMRGHIKGNTLGRLQRWETGMQSIKPTIEFPRDCTLCIVLAESRFLVARWLGNQVDLPYQGRPATFLHVTRHLECLPKPQLPES